MTNNQLNKGIKMINQLDIFDAVVNSQKQIFNNLISAQQDLRVQWIDGISKTHAAITSIPGLPENAQTKEALSQFNTWMGNVANQSQSVTEEALKAQETFISTYEKQLAVSRDLLKSFITSLPKAA
jgi:hypothetical protein